jgi:hypothetical protein
MSINFDPLSIMTIVLVQIGGKYLNFEITKAQEKILKHPIVQSIIFFSIIYITTKNLLLSFTILVLTYIMFKILFNENHKYNILSNEWLKKEGLLIHDNIVSLKNLYYHNMKINNE